MDLDLNQEISAAKRVAEIVRSPGAGRLSHRPSDTGQISRCPTARANV